MSEYIEEGPKYQSTYLECLFLFFGLLIIPRLIVKWIALPDVLHRGAHCSFTQQHAQIHHQESIDRPEK